MHREDRVFEVYNSNGTRLGSYGYGFRRLAIECAKRLGMGAFVRERCADGSEWGDFRRIGTVVVVDGNAEFMTREG